MLASLAQILLFQFAGESLSRGLGLPVPGPVLGMLMLFVFLLARGRVAEDMTRTAGVLLRYLPLFFVPAGVGVMLILPTLRREGAALFVVVILSTGLTIAVTAWLTQFLMRRGGKGGKTENADRPTRESPGSPP
jgi:holin-like protein